MKTKNPKVKQLYNPHISLVYQIERVRNKTRKSLLNEYIIFLINLYGHLIEDGTKRIADFSNMTMQDMRVEVQLRTRAMRISSNQKIRAHQDKEAKKQEELLRKLSQLN